MLTKIKVFSRSKDHVRCVSLVRERRSLWHAVRAFNLIEHVTAKIAYMVHDEHISLTMVALE